MNFNGYNLYITLPSPKDGWFPTFVGMVKRRKGNQFGEGVF